MSQDQHASPSPSDEPEAQRPITAAAKLDRHIELLQHLLSKGGASKKALFLLTAVSSAIEGERKDHRNEVDRLEALVESEREAAKTAWLEPRTVQLAVQLNTLTADIRMRQDDLQNLNQQVDELEKKKAMHFLQKVPGNPRKRTARATDDSYKSKSEAAQPVDQPRANQVDSDDLSDTSPLHDDNDYEAETEDEESAAEMRTEDCAASVNDPVSTSTPVKKKSRKSYLKWQEHLEHLREYKAKFGDVLVPARYKGHPGLGGFVRTVRARRQGGIQPPLSAEQIAELDSLGFCWQAAEESLTWEQRIQQLTDYKEKHGDLLVPRGYTDQDNLGLYVKFIRGRRKGITGYPLKPGQIAELEALGFVWEVLTRRVPWSERIVQLKEYKRENDTFMVPRDYRQQENLGNFVDFLGCRIRGSKGKPITADERADLDRIGYLQEFNKRRKAKKMKDGASA